MTRRRRNHAALIAWAAVCALWGPAEPTGSLRAQTARPADAGTAEHAVLAAMQWRSLGPNRGGRSIAAAGSAARPLEYYFGATGGGVFKTTDGGLTWQPVADKFLKTSSPGAVAVSESNPDVVYVGMGESCLRGNVIQGDGVYKTTDGGKTWAPAGLESTRVISRIEIHPANPDLVFAAALGNPYGAGPDRGVYRSKDGGQRWERVLFKSDKAGAVDLVLDPANPHVLYAAIWEVFRTPHSLSSGGPDSGLWKSEDGGTTWQDLTRNAGLPKGTLGRIGVAVSPADGRRVWALVEAGGDEGGLYLSDDAGTTWKQVNRERRFRQRAFYYTHVYADPKARDTVYVLNTGFYRSTDAGATWKTIRVPHGDNHDLWIAPDDPRRMINANDGGANVSFNGGETWTDQDIPTAQFYNAITTRHVPYHVCGGQQDNTTACVSSVGPPDVLYDAGGCESGYVAPDPRRLDVFFAGCYGGALTRFDRSTGQRRQVNVWPENPMGHSARDIEERVQWTFPIVFHPLDPAVLYTGSQHVWRSDDEGQTWRRISPDLTRNDPSTTGPSGGPITLDQTGVETYATVFTIAPSRRERDTIWAGSDDGLVHVTRDGGATWANVTPRDLPEFARISLIEASPHAPGTAFLAANRYQRDDRAPYVYRTDDYGASWTRIVSGIPADDFARVIREDPSKEGLLFLGTEHGVHVSLNGGRRWQSLRLDLPVVSVQGLVVEQNDLVIGTHGRGFYALPYVHVLRQLDPAVAPDGVRLYQPPVALRMRSVPFASTWRGGGFSGGGSGSVPIDYYLPKEAGAVTLEVLDARGQIVRTVTATAAEDEKREAARKEKAGPGDEEAGGPPPPPAPGRKAGLNRFVWNLRANNAPDFPGLIMWAGSTAGPLVPPGRYQVRLTADGATETQWLEVKRDARLQATDGDLQEQYDLARRISDRVGAAHVAVSRIRALKGQIEERVKASGGKAQPIERAAQALLTRLTDVEGEIYQWRNQSSQDPLNFPIKVNNKLAALQGVVESADARPTAQSYVVFEALSERLAAALAALEAVERNELTAFNRQLARRKLPAVVATPVPGEGGVAAPL
jgi:photosystem II stability/assembly factor-like uncharacterized protein